jgi:DNA-binding transcriptional ArsR family regulator
MIEFTVKRQLAQRRSLTEAQENVQYLANLPRTIGFRLLSAKPNTPVENGLLWEYTGVIQYEPKEHIDPERLAKDEEIIFHRIKRACEHKRWGRSSWRVERNGLASSGVPSSPSLGPDLSHHSDLLDREEESLQTSVLSNPREPDDQADDEDVDCEPELVEFTHIANPRRSTSIATLPDEHVVREVADKLAKIGEPSKLKIIYVLAQQERNVTDLCSDLGMQSQPTVSHHLSILRHCRLVETERDGQHNYYHLTDEGRQLADIVKQLVG